MILIIEGIVMCFILLIICVVGIANGPVGLVVFYEQEVKDRVVELGITTRERIKRISICLSIINGAVTLLNLAGDAAQSQRNRCSIRPVLVHWRGGIFNLEGIRLYPLK